MTVCLECLAQTKRHFAKPDATSAKPFAAKKDQINAINASSESF